MVQWCSGAQNLAATTHAGSDKSRATLRDRCYLDEAIVSIQGERTVLWRAADQDGDVLQLLLQKRKDKRAAKRIFRQLLKGQRQVPIDITTDKLPSYGAAKREVMPSVVHCTKKYANNRAEVSHEQSREQERQMRGFKSDRHAQRFLAVHGQVRNLFRLARHLLRAVNHGERTMESFARERSPTGEGSSASAKNR